MTKFTRLTTEEAKLLRGRMSVATARTCANCRYSVTLSNDIGDSELECRKSYGNPFFVLANEVCPAHRFSKED